MHHTSGIEMAQAHDVKFTLAHRLALDVDARRQFVASWLMPSVANHHLADIDIYPMSLLITYKLTKSLFIQTTLVERSNNHECHPKGTSDHWPIWQHHHS